MEVSWAEHNMYVGSGTNVGSREVRRKSFGVLLHTTRTVSFLVPLRCYGQAINLFVSDLYRCAKWVTHTKVQSEWPISRYKVSDLCQGTKTFFDQDIWHSQYLLNCISLKCSLSTCTIKPIFQEARPNCYEIERYQVLLHSNRTLLVAENYTATKTKELSVPNLQAYTDYNFTLEVTNSNQLSNWSSYPWKSPETSKY